ncbi:MAG: hypothetical protein GY751_24150, partial [Bacteroidetes bacterium]|nr:hypothetical protein [Bacteroidota bacterium]
YNDIIRCLGADPSGKYFFTGSSDRMIQQFEISSGEKIATFTGHKDEVYAIDIHPKGNRMLTGGSFDKSIKEWDTEKQSMLRSFGGSVYPIRDLALSENGDRLYISSNDKFGGDVYSWRLDRMNSMTNLGASDEHYQFMDLFKDEIAIANQSGDVKIFNSKTNALIEEAYTWQSINDIQYHPSGERLFLKVKDAVEDNWANYGYDELDRSSGKTLPFTSDKNRIPGNQTLHFNKQGDAYYIFESEFYGLNSMTMYADSNETALHVRSDTNRAPHFRMICPDGKHLLAVKHRSVDMVDIETGDIYLQGDTVFMSDILDITFIDEETAVFSGGGWSVGFVAVVDLKTLKVLRSRSDFNTGQGSVTYDPERKLIISGGEDARITLMDLDDLETRLTLFAFADTKGEWAAIHPSGLFDGSKDAIERFLYFTYKLEPIKLFQLKERYYEPGLIQKVLGYNSEPLRDVNRFNEVSMYPKANLRIEEQELNIRLTERSGGIGKISFLINGKEMLEDIAPLFNTGTPLSTKGYNAATIDLDRFSKYLITGKSNRLEIITSNLEGNITSSPYTIEYEPPLPTGFSQTIERPTLHAVIIGTSDYRGEALDLNFASKDAEDMANALMAGGNELFGNEHVEVHLLNTDQKDLTLQPTKENIQRIMSEIAHKARPEDVLMLYLSGHGVTYGSQQTQFHYLTKGVESGDISDPEIREDYTISTGDMTTWINTIPAQKQIMILDACASGQAVDDLLALDKNVSSSQIKAFDKMKDRTGLFIVAGSAANKASFEASQYGQSLLTYSLLSGLNVVSAKSEDKMVDLVEWLNYSKEKVPDLAGEIGGIQEPVVALPRNLNSFDIVRITDESMIMVADVKPVFVRSTLMEMNEMDDVLELSDLLDQYFQDMSADSRNSNLIFVDVKKFPSAYSIKGIYETIDDSVDLKVTLRKGDDILGVIDLTGYANDADALVQGIIREVNGLITEQ